jgi:hypothetical protein
MLESIELSLLERRPAIIGATGVLVLIAAISIRTRFTLGINLLSESGNLTLSYEDPVLISQVVGLYQYASALNAGIAAASLAACFGLVPLLRRGGSRWTYFLLYFVSLALFGLACLNYGVYSTIHYRLIDRSLDLSGIKNTSILGFEAHVSRDLGMLGELFLFTQRILFREGGLYIGMIFVVWILAVAVS